MTAEAGQEAVNQRDYDDLKAQQDMARAACWMIVVAFFQTVIAAFGLGALLRSLGHSRDTANASIRSADAAQESAAIAKATLSLTNRPWLGVKEISFKPFEANKPPEMDVYITNFGTGPAIRARANVHGTVIEGNGVPDQGPPGQTHTVYFPGRVSSFKPFAKPSRSLTADDIAAINDGSYRVWVTVNLVYEDTAGGFHRTENWMSYDSDRKTFKSTTDRDYAD